MKVIVKDYIIDTSLIKDISIWGEWCYGKESQHYHDEIAVCISYYKDRLIEKEYDVIVIGYESEDIEENIKNIDEARKIVEFIESKRVKVDYPIFE